MTITRDEDRAAGLLLKSRETGRLLAGFPEPLAPRDVAHAYRIQDALLRRIGPVAGWKVGGSAGGAPLCAPLPTRDFHVSGVELAVPAGGLEIEVETGLTISRDLDAPGRIYTETDLAEAVGSLHVAVELVGSRFVDRKAVSAESAIADLQSNHSVVFGPGRADWTGLDLEAGGLSLTIDGEASAVTQRHHSLATVISLATWLANHGAARGLPLRRGHRIITGARVGPMPLASGRSLTAALPGLGEVTVAFRH